eukprot:1538889-Alexandrium_andersonii.AAC.1
MYSAPYDWMHTVDMGIVPNLVGSTLDEFMQEMRGARSVNLTLVWERVQEIYEEQGTRHRIRRVTKDMVGGPFAHLTRCKAAELAALVPVMRQYVEERDTGSERDGHRVLAYQALEEMYNIIRSAPVFLSADQSAALTDACAVFLKHYNALATISLAASKL